MSKQDQKYVPPELLIGLIYLWLCFSVGPIAMIAAIVCFIVLLAVKANATIAFCAAMTAFVAGMLIHMSVVEWLVQPLKLSWLAYSHAFEVASILDWLLQLGAFSDFLNILFHQFGILVASPEFLYASIPLGGMFGAVSYNGFLFIKNNPISQIKRQRDRVRKHEKVGSFAAQMSNIKPADQSNGSLIGADRFGKSVILKDEDANQHVLVLGTTGAGKTVTISNIVESAIHRGLPLIYVDGKGDYDLARKVEAYAHAYSRPVWVFGMRGESVCYDPLASGGYTSKKDRIIELREWSEEHYKKLAEGYLQAVFKVMDALRLPSDLITLSQHLDLKKLKALVREHEKSLHNAQDLMDMLNTQDKASKAIDSLVAEIQNFTQSEIGHLFQAKDNQDVLTLEKVIKNNGIAYFCLPALEFPSMSQTLGRLIINDLKATMGQFLVQHQRPKLYAIFDEFSVFAGEQVLNVINMGRSAGIHAVLSTQSLSDIASGRKENADHFINQAVGNCNTFIMHRQNSPEDAETLASIIGTRPSLEYTAQISQQEATHMGTVRRTRGFLAHPDDIKSLGKGEAYYYSKQNNKLTRIRARLSKIFK
ncbi:MAG: DUF853 family protein [Alphaproteobacteria bacterium]|nr:DUF853 family protein [Alphaproteobacteria bacterium]